MKLKCDLKLKYKRRSKNGFHSIIFERTDEKREKIHTYALETRAGAIFENLTRTRLAAAKIRTGYLFSHYPRMAELWYRLNLKSRREDVLIPPNFNQLGKILTTVSQHTSSACVIWSNRTSYWMRNYVRSRYFADF